MSTFPGSPKLIKGGLVVLDARRRRACKRTIALQYNPDTLTRSYQVQGVGGEGGGERAQPFRLKGPAIETIKLEAEIDATDQLEYPEQQRRTRRSSASRRSSPRSKRWSIRRAASCWRRTPTVAVGHARDPAARGAAGDVRLEHEPRRAGARHRVLGHRGSLRPGLNPIRAKVSLGLRVLTIDDLGFDAPRRQLFITYLRTREALARKAAPATLPSLGLNNLP